MVKKLRWCLIQHLVQIHTKLHYKITKLRFYTTFNNTMYTGATQAYIYILSGHVCTVLLNSKAIQDLDVSYDLIMWYVWYNNSRCVSYYMNMTIYFSHKTLTILKKPLFTNMYLAKYVDTHSIKFTIVSLFLYHYQFCINIWHNSFESHPRSN